MGEGREDLNVQWEGEWRETEEDEMKSEEKAENKKKEQKGIVSRELATTCTV